MGPGRVCGEFGLLDDSPRSASVYAHSDVVAQRLSAVALRDLCNSDPAAAIKMMRWLSRSAAGKARAFSKNLEEFILTGEPDPALDALVARAAAAQRDIAGWPERKVDDLIIALATQIADCAYELAEVTVAETGIGCVADKAVKNRFASRDVAQSLVGKPGVGVVGRDEHAALTQIADPMGVVVGLIPMTNPVFDPDVQDLDLHQGARRADCKLPPRRGARRRPDRGHLAAGPGAARSAGRPGAKCPAAPYPPDDRGADASPGCVDNPRHGRSGHGQSRLQFRDAALGVGSGNAPVWVCADADAEAAAQAVVSSKAFDHGIICGSENNLVVDRSVRDSFTAALQQAGAAVLNVADCDRLARAAFDETDGRLRRSVLGQPAASIAAAAGIQVPPGARLLIAPVPREALSGPYGSEKLAPILSLFTADGEDDGIRLCRQILGNGGAGHTAIIHTRSERRQLSFAQQMPASRILVNGPGSQGCIGLGNGLIPSLTLGCGTYGRTSTTDNVTYTNLVNMKRVAHPLPGTGALSPQA